MNAVQPNSTEVNLAQASSKYANTTKPNPNTHNLTVITNNSIVPDIQSFI